MMAQRTVAMRRWGPLAIARFSAAMAALTVLNADAAARPARRVPPTEATAPRDAGEPIMAIVSIKTQQVTFYDADGWIMRAPVSTGTTERQTPAGVFAVVEKDKDHRSTLYDDAEMPTCSASPGTVSRCTAGRCPGMRPHTAAFGCLLALRRSCSTRRGSACVRTTPPNDAEPVGFSPSGAVRAEPGGHRGRVGQGRGARPRGGRGCQDGR